jgi:hypothetical protein
MTDEQKSMQELLFALNEKTLNNLSSELANRVNQKHYIIHILKTVLLVGFQMGWNFAIREQKKEAA